MRVWEEVDKFLAEHAHTYKMSFGLEYSNIIGWMADFTPRRNHPKALQYWEVWVGEDKDREKAIIKALEKAKKELSNSEHENVIQ